jgi:hypothetical protein
MAILVRMRGNSVINTEVPGTDPLYQELMEAAGFTFRTEPDGTPVAPGWEYDPELEAYFDPNA